MNKEIQNILESVAKWWEYETEYNGIMERVCFYCGEWQEGEEKHKKNCLSLKAREIIKKNDGTINNRSNKECLKKYN